MFKPVEFNFVYDILIPISITNESK